MSQSTVKFQRGPLPLGQICQQKWLDHLRDKLIEEFHNLLNYFNPCLYRGGGGKFAPRQFFATVKK